MQSSAAAARTVPWVGRTAAANATVRSVFVIGPDKKVKMTMTYAMTSRRNFDEILRVLDSIQLTMKHKVATPVKWKQGEDVIIAGSVSDDEAKKVVPRRLEGTQALPAGGQATALIPTAVHCGLAGFRFLADPCRCPTGQDDPRAAPSRHARSRSFRR